MKSNTALATRGGNASATSARVDLSAMALLVTEHRKEVKEQVETLLEGCIVRIRALKLAGMINKTGADETCNDIILAMHALEQVV